MEDFVKGFVREAKGTWRCMTPIDLELPEGRVHVEPGTVLVRGSVFMDVDLAQLLDEQQEREDSRPNWLG